MSTQLTAPQRAVKHPAEGRWYEFSYAKIIGEGVTILQTGTPQITDVPGLVFDTANLIIEDQSVFVYVTEGVAGETYHPLCLADTTKDGISVYEEKVAQRGTIIVSED